MSAWAGSCAQVAKLCRYLDIEPRYCVRTRGARALRGTWDVACRDLDAAEAIQAKYRPEDQAAIEEVWPPIESPRWIGPLELGLAAKGTERIEKSPPYRRRKTWCVAISWTDARGAPRWARRCAKSPGSALCAALWEAMEGDDG